MYAPALSIDGGGKRARWRWHGLRPGGCCGATADADRRVRAWRDLGGGERRADTDRRESAVDVDRGDVEGATVLIPIPSGSRVWIATSHTDMRRGTQGLALQVQEGLK